MNSTVLVIYPYFPPAQKAGGIASSLSNLITLLKDDRFFVYTSCYDLDGSLLEVSSADRWLDFSPSCKVFYATTRYRPDFRDIVERFNINTLYINGLYGMNYSIQPLWQLKQWNRSNNHKIVIAPRGMVQKNSLKIKSLKKQLYFSLLKALKLYENVWFHVTEKQESEDTKRFFKSERIMLVKDCPNTDLKFLKKSTQVSSGGVSLVFLSLLAKMKNLEFLLDVMTELKEYNITLDIYGPIKDQYYWNNCLSIINQSANISYCGEVAPSEVTRIINNYDYFVLPTLGENFGHVIFESLVAGTPVIISDRTPWTNIDNNKVGWSLTLDKELWSERLMALEKIDASDYNEMSANCHRYIKDYLENNNPVKDYEKLFA